MVDLITEQFDPYSIILFGSRARGDTTIHSDVDLLVIMDEDVDKSKKEVEIASTLYASPIAKDVTVTTQNDFTRYSKVPGMAQLAASEEGIAIYERQ